MANLGSSVTTSAPAPNVLQPLSGLLSFLPPQNSQLGTRCVICRENFLPHKTPVLQPLCHPMAGCDSVAQQKVTMGAEGERQEAWTASSPPQSILTLPVGSPSLQTP